MIEPKLKEYTLKYLKEQRVKPIYISLSGSHLYGFESEDSDYDIRCCHIKPTTSLFRMHKTRDTLEHKTVLEGVEVEIVSHEVEKVLRLVLQNNSNIIENINAKNMLPTLEYETLKRLMLASLSKKVFNPYNGMAEFNYRKFIAKNQLNYPMKKKYLYVIRAYMAGIYVLENQRIEPNLAMLNREYFHEPIVDRLIELKRKTSEKSTLMNPKEIQEANKLILKLKSRILLAKNEASLPDNPQTLLEIDDYLYNIRLRSLMEEK